MKKIKTKRELKESLEDELLSLESEDDGDTVADVEEEEECETCGETPCVCDEEGDEEVEESEEPIVVEDDDEDEDEDEDEESEESEESEEGEEELDIDCGCEPTGEEEFALDGEEEEEDEDEESELAKARAEEGDLEESDCDDEEEEYEESIDYSGVKKLVEEEEGLTESFKAKAALIFESEVRSQIGQIKEQLQSEYDTKLVEETSQYRETLSEQVDSYLSYAVEQWLKENAVAIEKGLRTNIAENFMSSLKTLFQESYIEVPESKTDLYSELEKESAQLKEDLAKANHIAIHLSEKVDRLSREQILESATKDLAKTQAAKLVQLVENVEYEGDTDFADKVNTLKKFYFENEKKGEINEEVESKTKAKKSVFVSKETIVEGAKPEEVKLPKAMESYLGAITRLNRARGVN